MTRFVERAAFPSFAAPEDLELFEVILAHPPRPRGVRSARPRLHALPNVRCAFVVAKAGGVEARATARGAGADRLGRASLAGACGRKLTAKCGKARGGGAWTYECGACAEEGHVGAVVRTLDDAVLATALARFAPEALAAAVDAQWLDEAAARERRPALKREVQRLEALLRAAGASEDEARADGDAEAVREARARAAFHREKLREARAALGRLTADAGMAAALTAADAARVRALATDLPALLARARGVEGAARRIVAELVRAVHVRRVARGVLAFGVEFPTGEVEWRRLVTTAVAIPEAQRAYVRARLGEGAALERVAEEVAAALSVRRAAARWDAERVRQAAALGEGDDAAGGARASRLARAKGTARAAKARAQHRGGPAAAEWLTVPELAARLGVAEARALGVVLLGRVGETAVVDGAFRVLVRERELQARFSDYARRTVAAAAGWPLGDVENVRYAMDRTGLSRRALRGYADAGAGRRRDLYRREYLRRSDVTAALAERLAPALARSPHARLDPEGWVRVGAAARRLGVAAERLLRTRPSVHATGGGSGRGGKFVWLEGGLPAESRSRTQLSSPESEADR